MLTTEQFKQRLHSLVDLEDGFGALVYFAIKGDEGVILKKANIQGDVLTRIAKGYRESLLAELQRFEQDAQMAVVNLSDRDERANVIYRFDIPDTEPSYFSIMREPLEQPDTVFTGNKMFNFDRDTFSDIDYFVIELGAECNKVVVYRDNFNVNLLKRGPGRIFLSKSGTQITTVDNDVLRMDSQIDCLLLDSDFYIINLKNLDTCKEFADLIRVRATQALGRIAELPYIDNVEGLRDRIQVELSFARRLMRAMDNSPITRLPPDTILDFVRNHHTLHRVLRINGDKFVLMSKRSQNALISLLNDDFLYSKLTQRDYETLAKGPVVE